MTVAGPISGRSLGPLLTQMSGTKALSSLGFPAPFLGRVLGYEIRPLWKPSLCLNLGCHKGQGEEGKRQCPLGGGSHLPGRSEGAGLTGEVSLWGSTWVPTVMLPAPLKPQWGVGPERGRSPSWPDFMPGENSALPSTGEAPEHTPPAQSLMAVAASKTRTPADRGWGLQTCRAEN